MKISELNERFVSGLFSLSIGIFIDAIGNSVHESCLSGAVRFGDNIEVWLKCNDICDGLCVA